MPIQCFSIIFHSYLRLICFVTWDFFYCVIEGGGGGGGVVEWEFLELYLSKNWGTFFKNRM